MNRERQFNVRIRGLSGRPVWAADRTMGAAHDCQECGKFIEKGERHYCVASLVEYRLCFSCGYPRELRA